MSGPGAVPPGRNPSLRIGVRELPGRSVMPNRPLPSRARYQRTPGAGTPSHSNGLDSRSTPDCLLRNNVTILNSSRPLRTNKITLTTAPARQLGRVGGVSTMPAPQEAGAGRHPNHA